MSDEKMFWCSTCRHEVPEDQTKETKVHGSAGELLFMPQRVHSLCGTPVTEYMAGTVPFARGGIVSNAAAQEAWKIQEQLTDSFVSHAMRVHVQHREQEWREMIQAALKLVEENPRNEPMRTEISRPAVERMLAEDLCAVGADLDSDVRAHELFDLGWRPTIDRLVR